MDQSYSDSDISLSPSRILQRLQVLRQVQLLQRGKLQNQQLQYQDTTETTSNITEIVSHFSNTTSYNTFRSLLQSSLESSNEPTPRQNIEASRQFHDKDLVEGVSVLNISQESEYIYNSPISARSRVSVSTKAETTSELSCQLTGSNGKKHISLDEMPILSPRKDFENMILEKLQSIQHEPKKSDCSKPGAKRTFLKKGEGMTRFGLKKDSIIIQNTKSLPWRQRQSQNKLLSNKDQPNIKQLTPKTEKKVTVQILMPLKNQTIEARNKQQEPQTNKVNCIENNKEQKTDERRLQIDNTNKENLVKPNCELHTANVTSKKPINIKPKHPLVANKGKTWANVLTKEQDDFLRQLKQSDYYKNFNSPAKSIVSDVSCDEALHILKNEREQAEQNMFEFLENKVSSESFHLDSSFINKFLRKTQFECSGESTPVVMQKCLKDNPDLLHILSDLSSRNRTNSVFHTETSCSEYSDCSSTSCSTPSTCCSCKTDEILNETPVSEHKVKKTGHKKKVVKNDVHERGNCLQTNQSHEDNVINKEMKANMEEMNAKLVATSDLLKDRLRELEDEIETFRKENANLVKMREEFDQEKHKFYEEKTTFEQKFNEEKILSEYYMAEEKEKLTKQKQMYERYVREMRGRLNKKEKDEVITLKREISELKADIQSKDAKSTATIARLRNQLKILEKEKKELQEEVDKLKKEKRRIQHSNDVTRRLTNMKYLAEINKKLSQMTSKENLADVILDRDVKYKAFEIERQSRKRNTLPVDKKTVRPRAKSVPNLNVTSQYAKYFSQRDVISHAEPNDLHTYTCASDNEKSDHENVDNESLDDAESLTNHNSDQETNELEKLYIERFQSNSPPTSTNAAEYGNGDGFFINKSKTKLNSARISNSPTFSLSNRSSMSSNPRTSTENKTSNVNKPFNSNKSNSPSTILGNASARTLQSNGKLADFHSDSMSVSPEPAPKTSITKTNLNPTEIKKPDGSKEIKFSNGNVKFISADGKYCKFVYYNGDIKENFYSDGRIKYFYSENKTVHTTYPDGLEVLEFADGQIEKRYKDGSSEISLPNGSIRYFDPKNEYIREEWRFPDGTTLTVSANGEQRIVFPNGQVEVHAADHKRREFPDGTVKLVYTDGTAETRYASGRIRIKDKHGNLLMDSVTR